MLCALSVYLKDSADLCRLTSSVLFRFPGMRRNPVLLPERFHVAPSASFFVRNSPGIVSRLSFFVN